MPCSPLEILTVAKHLQAQSGDEATRRSIASRAYYAALHQTKDTFSPVQTSALAHESSHEKIIARAFIYGNSRELKPGRSSAAMIAKTLNKLRRKRNEADYQLDDAFGEGTEIDCLARAEAVMALCAEVAGKMSAVSADGGHAAASFGGR